MYKYFFKRVFDVVFSLLAMIVLTPVYFTISILVLIKMGKPILFGQDRIGKKGKPFKLYKFRSMTNARDESGNLLDEQERLTKFGVVLRSSSLDELPELWAIFIGKMSFIGPRPLPVYYDPYFLDEERKRHLVRGGLVPPDVLSGKAVISWEEQFEYEVYYAEHLSFILDVKILFATFKVLFKRVRENYGAEDRPHLNEYRSNVHNEIGENHNELSVE